MDTTEADTATFNGTYSFTPPFPPPNTRALSTPVPGDHDLTPLRTEGALPQSPDATVLRLPSPFPFLRQFSNISQHGVDSSGGNSASQYLSTPILDSGGETPPYKPDSDDYFSLNMYQGHKRKRNTIRRHSSGSGSREISDPASAAPQLHSIHESLTGIPDAVSSRWCDTKSDDCDTPESVPAAQKRITAKPQGQRETGRSLLPAIGQNRPYGLLMSRSTPVSTLINALASGDAKDSKARASSTEDGSIVRAWSTGRVAGKQRSHNSLEGNQNSKGRERSAGKLETPATITLRKASELCGATFAVSEYGLQTPDTSARLAIDQQAAKAITDADPQDSTAGHPGVHAQSLLECSPLPEAGASQADAGSHATAKPKSNRERARAADRFCATSGSSRQSGVADPAITFADVHTAPGTFPITASSQKSSLSPLAQLRRKSAVHIVSRSSIHEIIWNEDDSASGCSSDDADSPPIGLQSTDADSGAANDDASYVSPTNSNILSCCGAPEKSRMLSQNNGESKETRAQESEQRLFEWSWSRRQSIDSIDSNANGDSAIVSNDITPIEPSQAQDPGSRKRSTLWRKKFILIPTVESFPSLPDRRSTAEWQKSPLMDLNDSQTGRNVYMEITPPTPNEAGMERRSSVVRPSFDNPDTVSRRSSVKSHPYAPARVAQQSKEGCAIGISSHKRRNSHRHDHRRLSSNGSQLTKLLERKPSLLKRNFSDAHSNSQEDCGPMVDPGRYRRSTESPSYFSELPGHAAGGLVPLPLTSSPASAVCQHGAKGQDRLPTENVGNNIPRPLKLVGSPEIRADCNSCKNHSIGDRAVSVD
ncbi:hypothetical protein MMC08_008791 [Hypocenomyce scalaris]|nr:hypothetical protein [Hypocenomyce scalaris]